MVYFFGVFGPFTNDTDEGVKGIQKLLAFQK